MHGPIFLQSFASDRSHMKDTAGNWVAQPPPYEAIVAEGKCKKQTIICHFILQMHQKSASTLLKLPLEMLLFC